MRHVDVSSCRVGTLNTYKRRTPPLTRMDAQTIANNSVVPLQSTFTSKYQLHSQYVAYSSSYNLCTIKSIFTKRKQSKILEGWLVQRHNWFSSYGLSPLRDSQFTLFAFFVRNAMTEKNLDLVGLVTSCVSSNKHSSFSLISSRRGGL